MIAGAAPTTFTQDKENNHQCTPPTVMRVHKVTTAGGCRREIREAGQGNLPLVLVTPEARGRWTLVVDRHEARVREGKGILSTIKAQACIWHSSSTRCKEEEGATVHAAAPAGEVEERGEEEEIITMAMIHSDRTRVR